jgi:type III restriction enzyme
MSRPKTTSEINLGAPKITVDKRLNPNVENNLNPKFKIRPYQAEAFSRFHDYTAAKNSLHKPAQLLFQMATGSGKTLIMAGCILDLYKKGYTNFIFFVNSSNLIDKTRDNFLNPSSSKYLFSDTIAIENKTVKIKEVKNFEAVNQNEINIVFTTIQGLHSRLNTPRENALTFEDFENNKIVLLSDEAHHINAETKKAVKNNTDRLNLNSWETTVNKIFEANEDNYLLEFTATIDLSNQAIEQKYKNKILFTYPLKQFRKDGYSKEVKVLQSNLTPFDRALQAVILSQYRKKLFEHQQIDIKPVILFKSKTIKASQDFLKTFTQGLKKLTENQLVQLKNNAEKNSLAKAFNYFEKRTISLSNLIIELKEEFSEMKCLVVNSKNDSIEKQLVVNTLEDRDNPYRAIFAVNKLNEGWDVLNLFDIVKLDDKKTAASGKVKKTTLSEAQLIGRGARYCPFKIHGDQVFDKRKYDQDPKNDLKICEELFYHSAHNPRYIAELNSALKKIGMQPTEREIKHRKTAGNLEDFKKSPKLNQRQTSSQSELSSSIRKKTYWYKLKDQSISTESSFELPKANEPKTVAKIYNLTDFERPILRKAVDQLPFYNFDNLKNHFPELSSISEFISSDKFLNPIKVEVKGQAEHVKNLTKADKLVIGVDVLEKIAALFSGHQTPAPVLPNP